MSALTLSGSGPGPGPGPDTGCSADPSGTDVHLPYGTALRDTALSTAKDDPPALLPHSHSPSPSAGSASKPTNAFHGLVAWFSKDVHPTAKYAWSEYLLQHCTPSAVYNPRCFLVLQPAFHKGTLASLPGIESGDLPVDVMFAQPRDPLLKRYTLNQTPSRSCISLSCISFTYFAQAPGPLDPISERQLHSSIP